MYYYASLISIVLLVALGVGLVLRKGAYSRFNVYLSIALLASTLIAITPQKAVEGAPFHKYGEEKIAFTGCKYQISRVASFCNTPDTFSGNDASCFCGNPNALATISHCYKFAYPKLLDSLIQICKQEGNISLDHEDIENAHKVYLSQARDVENTGAVNFPVKLDDSSILLFRNAYDQFLGNYDRSIDYGGYLVLYWAVVFSIAAIGNWSKFIFATSHKHLTDPFTNWYRKSISLPATYGSRKTNEKKFFFFLDMLVPTRAETIILSTFLGLTSFLAFYKIQYFEGDPIFHHKQQALLRYFAVRCSILTSAMMPLLILFGGRNNFLQWLTKWDYSTFITLHRWLSRIIFILVAIHTFFYTFYFGRESPELRKKYVLWGVAAFFSGILIIIQGLLVLRRKYYELFLASHIVLAFIFIGGAWIHVHDLYCEWFYYVAGAIWFFDRVVRVGRIYSFGFPQAEVHLLADETLKLTVPRPKHWETVPGGHAFIHFLRPSCFWQSHPFTYTISTTDNQLIILFMKVKKGVTLSLYKSLLASPQKKAFIRVAIEGSYGEDTPARRYDTSVFVAGGNGIPGIYAGVMDLVKPFRHTSQKLKLIWVVREYKSILWFYDELVSLNSTGISTTVFVTKPHSYEGFEGFDLRFGSSTLPILESSLDKTSLLVGNRRPLHYGTDVEVNSIESTELLLLTGSDIISHIKHQLSHIDFEEGRPSIENIVRSTIKNSSGSSCFITCGHPVMVDELRAAVVKNIDNEYGKRVDYFEQLQVWA
jgi:predicted ferric reductase